jgi:hypothetical protein
LFFHKAKDGIFYLNIWACRHKESASWRTVGLSRYNLFAKSQQKGFTLASLTHKIKV